MEKIVVCIMGQNCEKFIGMCLESVKDADAIVYCDGGSGNGCGQDCERNEKQEETVWNILSKYKFDFPKSGIVLSDGKPEPNKIVIQQKYNQEDKKMNGKQRNFYLDYLKENYKGWFALCLDADEVVEDFGKIKEFINTLPQENNDILFSIKMRHFISDLGHEDATQQVHFVPHRLFKIKDNLTYPETEHPVLQIKDLVLRNKKVEFRSANVQPTTIWHLAYIPNLFEYKKKYENHIKKSEIHSKQFLDAWYRAHIFGRYPKSQIDLTDIPSPILEEFGIDKDELYFMDRGLEVKHSEMVKQWNDYFKPESVLDLGCGRGCYLHFWKWFVEKAQGIEMSKWAVENAFCSDIKLGNIIDSSLYVENQKTNYGYNNEFSSYELITAIDVLEHLSYEDLDNVLKNMSENGYKFLFSIPYKEDPHLEDDKTHIIKESKEWWVKKLSEFFVVKEAPKEWLFSNQILIGEKK